MPICTYCWLLISLFPQFWNALIGWPSKRPLLQCWPGICYLRKLILPIWDSWMGEVVGVWWERGGRQSLGCFSSPKGSGPEIKGREAKNIIYVKITNFRCKIYTSSLRKPNFLDRIDKLSRQQCQCHGFQKQTLFSHTWRSWYPTSWWAEIFVICVLQIFKKWKKIGFL